jgi:hypothetical protein
MQEWKDAPEWMTRKSERCAKDFFALIEIAKRSELTLTIYAAHSGKGLEVN